MIHIKNKEEIEIMTQGGKILSEVLWEVMDSIKPGVTESDLDRLAEKLIRAKGGEPGFKRVRGYKHTICASTNDVVVHGIPGDVKFKEGDVVGVDCGVYYKGFHTDMAETRRVSEKREKRNPFGKLRTQEKRDEIDAFLEVGKQGMLEAIKMAVVGNRVGHISKKMQDVVEKQGGYSIVRSLIGHGVGKELHEAPEVPGYLAEPIERTPLLKEGMTIAVEAIYNMGHVDVMLDPDGWTIRTRDGKMAGLFERSIVITKDGPILLTP
jgi:methionyl aminopeptidase